MRQFVRQLNFYKLFRVVLLTIIFFLIFTITSSSLHAAKNAIGIRIARNAEHLSPSEWYDKYAAHIFSGSGGPSSMSLGGYEAVDVGSCSGGQGQTIYTNAANVLDPNATQDDIRDDAFYTNIYIISCPIGADQDTIDIFEQLIDNWSFNVNIEDLVNPASFDAEILKAQLQRDTKRLSDLVELQDILEDYRISSSNNRYPDLPSGTYEVGKSLSYWKSWQDNLGDVVEDTLPTPPPGWGWGPLTSLEDWQGNIPWLNDMFYPDSVGISWNNDGCRVVSALKGTTLKSWIDDYGCVGPECGGCVERNDAPTLVSIEVFPRSVNAGDDVRITVVITDNNGIVPGSVNADIFEIGNPIAVDNVLLLPEGTEDTWEVDPWATRCAGPCSYDVEIHATNILGIELP